MKATISNKIFVFLCLLGNTIVVDGNQLPSAFRADPRTTYKSKVCFNIGSKDETVGPYVPETESISFPFGGIKTSEIINVGKKIKHRRAFQLVRSHFKEYFFTVQVEPWYRYNVDLGFIDAESACRNGGSTMNISVSDEMTTYDLNPFREEGCAVPYIVRFFRVSPDSWNRLNISIRGNPPASFATACIEKDSASLPQRRGTIYVNCDDKAEIFLNGNSILNVTGCDALAKVDVSIKYGDVISARCENIANTGGLQLAFIINGREIFGTGDVGWKTRFSFPSPGSPLAWTQSDYVDDDWTDALKASLECSSSDFPTETPPIWIHDGAVRETVYFRYTYT